jgi:hypothetical protein
MADLLTPQAIVEVFIRLGAEPEAITSSATRRLVPRTEIDMGVVCGCASQFDCGSSMSYDCFESWCLSQRHCGYYADETCWGKCKKTGY